MGNWVLGFGNMHGIGTSRLGLWGAFSEKVGKALR